jgi:hypothetical protein
VEDEADDDDEDTGGHEIYRDGKVHVLSAKCKSCIFRGVNDGRIRGLKPGRVAGMVQDARADGSCIPCHSTIWTESVEPAICRGFFDLPHRPAILQMAERMDAIAYDDPPEVDY